MASPLLISSFRKFCFSKFCAMPDPPPETALSQSQQIDVSNSDTISLISSLLDAKLQKTFGDFKRSLDEHEVETWRELKKLKTDSKAASSLQFKGNRIQFEFNTQLLHCLDLAFSNQGVTNRYFRYSINIDKNRLFSILIK